MKNQMISIDNQMTLKDIISKAQRQSLETMSYKKTKDYIRYHEASESELRALLKGIQCNIMDSYGVFKIKCKDIKDSFTIEDILDTNKITNASVNI